MQNLGLVEPLIWAREETCLPTATMSPTVPDQRVLCIGVRPQGRGSGASVRTPKSAEPNKWRWGGRGAWGSSCEPWSLATPSSLLLVYR